MKFGLAMFGALVSTLWWWVRPVVKWVLRRTTRLCELQRVCYGQHHGALMTTGVEFSLDHSRTPELLKVTRHLDLKAKECTLRPDLIQFAVFALVRIKGINTKVHRKFPGLLDECMTQVWGYRQLVSVVEGRRGVAYQDHLHDALLYRLWDALVPDTAVQGRVTKQWQDIGFQGDDPKTDFRGMGLLGLENLVFFAEEHTSAARHVLARSQHPKYGYSFAVVGINLTHMAYTLLCSGEAKTHFFNASKRFLELKAFHQFYCHLFFHFDQLWRQERPRDIMEFSRVRDKFEKRIKDKLKDPMAFFKCQFVLENV